MLIFFSFFFSLVMKREKNGTLIIEALGIPLLRGTLPPVGVLPLSTNKCLP